jgi:predicted nucleic acid-binding protein
LKADFTVDTSVLVAAFCTWHELHDEANELAAPELPVIAHCAAECFSVLTRLPQVQRVSAEDASNWLQRRFSSPWLALSSRGYAQLIARAPQLGIAGGAIYDGIVAETAREAGLRLESFDLRAKATYRALGIEGA